MTKPYETRTLSVIVAPVGADVFSELATKITIEDEGGGEFLSVEQVDVSAAGRIHIDKIEWVAIRDAIDKMLGECRDLLLADESQDDWGMIESEILRGMKP